MYVPAGRGGSSVTAGPRQADVADTVTIEFDTGAQRSGQADIGLARLTRSPADRHAGSFAERGCDVAGAGSGVGLTSTAGVVPRFASVAAGRADTAEPAGAVAGS